MTEINLDKYLTKPKGVEQKIKAEIEEQLESLITNKIEIENPARHKLQKQQALYTYPQISLEFLSESTGQNVNNTTITIPSYAVFKKNQPSFILNIKHSEYKIALCNFLKTNPLIEEQILKSLILEETYPVYSTTEVYTNYKLRFRNNKVKKIYNNFIFKKQFNTIIPTNIKKQLTKANKLFEEEIYFASKTEPEDWNNDNPNGQTIIFGKLKEQFYYLGQFKPIEVKDIK